MIERMGKKDRYLKTVWMEQNGRWTAGVMAKRSVKKWGEVGAFVFRGNMGGKFAKDSKYLFPPFAKGKWRRVREDKRKLCRKKKKGPKRLG